VGEESSFSETEGNIQLQRSIREGKIKNGNRKVKGIVNKRKNNNNQKKGASKRTIKSANKKAKKQITKNVQNKGVRGIQKKTVKAKKESRKVSGNSGTPRQDGCVTSTSCIKLATDYYSKDLLKKVYNFKVQKDRIKTYSKQASGKDSKNSDFQLLINRLREAGGGNSSNLTCNGETGAGANYLTTLSSTIASCEQQINDACDSSASGPGANQTYIDECAVKVDLFEDMTTAATKAKGAAACELLESADLAAASEDIKACTKITVDYNKQVTKAKKNFTNAFSACKTAEDEVITAISSCSPPNTVKKVALAVIQGNKNIEAATSLKTKVDTEVSAADSAATVAAGKLTTTCASFIAAVDEAADQLENAPLLSTSEDLLKEALDMTVSPACTAMEAMTLNSSGVSFNASIGAVEKAIAVKQGDAEMATGTELVITTTITPATTTGTTAETTTVTMTEASTVTTDEASTITTHEASTITTAEASTITTAEATTPTA